MLSPHIEIQEEVVSWEPVLEDESEVSHKSIKNSYIEEVRGKYIVFRECILENVVFSDVHCTRMEFSHVRFINCDLSNINLEEAIFHCVQFIGCKLVGSYFPEGTMQYVQFEDCVARYFNVGFNTLKEVAFSKCDLTEAHFGNCKHKKLSFNECLMERIDFGGTVLGGVNLATCAIAGMKVQLAHLRKAKVSTQQAIELAKLIGIEIVDGNE